jgi:hypothetical protein
MTEVGRQLEGVRFASPDDRIAVIERATRLGVGGSVQLTPPELVHTPDRYRRADGSSRLRPEDHRVYSSAVLLDAEERLVRVARARGGTAVSFATVAEVAAQDLPGKDYAMSTDQYRHGEHCEVAARAPPADHPAGGTGRVA